MQSNSATWFWLLLIGVGLWYMATLRGSNMDPAAPPAPVVKTLVIFSGPNCPACFEMRRVMSSPAVQVELSHWQVRDGTDAERQQYGVTAIPTLVILPGGKMHVGAMSESEFLSWLQS